MEYKFENFFNKKYDTVLLLIALFELLSLNLFILPRISHWVFLILILLFIYICFWKLEYGLFIVFCELIIGSKGYLLFLDIFSFRLSFRIALWSCFVLVWFLKFVFDLYHKKISLKKLIFNTYIKAFIPLFIFIIWGLVNAFINHNGTNNIFFDFNAWLYFLLIFPFFYIFEIGNKKILFQNLLAVFSAGIIWVSIKSMFLLYVFSHQLGGLTSTLYKWVRDTGVGEITRMEGDFYRIFFQSHIYVLIGFLVFLFLGFNMLTKRQKNQAFQFFTASALLLSVNLLSLSRSNWIGLLFGVILIIVLQAFKKQFKSILKIFGVLVAQGIMAVIIIFIIVNVPWPERVQGVNTASLLGNRASQISGEAGVGSRWKLLPPIINELKSAPIFGKGFGKTVTYKSEDPRILESNSEGTYTTYAFEWGWLDIWLKLGIGGFLAFLYIYLIIFRKFIKIYRNENYFLEQIFIIGLFSVAAVNFFSPYLNHPLGIGYLIITAILLEYHQDSINFTNIKN